MYNLRFVAANLMYQINLFSIPLLLKLNIVVLHSRVVQLEDLWPLHWWWVPVEPLLAGILLKRVDEYHDSVTGDASSVILVRIVDCIRESCLQIPRITGDTPRWFISMTCHKYQKLSSMVESLSYFTLASWYISISAIVVTEIIVTEVLRVRTSVSLFCLSKIDRYP